jgi:hypothetical protein
MRMVCLLWVFIWAAQGAVRNIYVVERGDVLDGVAFGSAGPYERVVARVEFGLNPKLAANRMIRDLQFAPLDEAGEVGFAADLFVLKPRDPARGNGTALFEVANRGGKGMLNRFNFARTSRDPREAEDFGDKWLLEQGYTLVWLGWEWDIPASLKDGLRLYPPHFRADALPAAGLVRSEFIPDKKVTVMPLGDRTQEPIPLAKPIALYARDAADEPAREIPSGAWKLSKGARSIEMPAGFEPGRFYEFVYEGKDPVVVGTGLAGVRDLISFLKYGGAETLLGDRTTYTRRAIGFGVSQSGRFLRHFLYEGFNADEKGRKVFDGVWADVAGAGRGSFNFRYAQASRDGCPYLNVFYPTDLFPFTDEMEQDPRTGKEDGLLARARAEKVVPKIFYTNNSYEYWGRVAALVHVSADGKRDVPLAPDTRYYFLAGVQHSPRSLPLTKPGTRYTANPVDHRPVQRALLAAMQAWLKDGTQPPPSMYPKLAEGQLTSPDRVKFPAIEGVRVPPHPRLARRLDFGPDFERRGVILREPPEVRGAFPLLVPQVDADGIDLGGIRLPELAVPLATITGWNLRSPERGAPEEMTEFLGSFFPFASTEIRKRYASRNDYMRKVGAAADGLIRRRFVLPQDRELVIGHAAKLWDARVKP